MLDRDGLQVAFLGVALAHWLDLESGEIIDLPLDAPAPGDPARYLRIPTRTAESEAADRRLFLDKVEFSLLRDRLAHTVDDAAGFRRLLSEDRRLERSFFNFKNDRASAAIEEWIREQGLDER